MKKDMKTYYKDRANVYEQGMYLKDDPDRKIDIAQISKLLTKLFKNKRIIEVACGTGYWTQILSKVAKNIVATDAVEEVLTLAKSKEYSCHVRFETVDAYKLPYDSNSFDAGLANFWFSHILRKDLSKFLDEFHRVLKDKSIIFFCDNILHPERDGIFFKRGNDSFRVRKANNQEYDVVKNYYTKDDFIKIFSPYAKNSKVNVVMGGWAWWVWYEKK